jgi:hypothetical protein
LEGHIRSLALIIATGARWRSAKTKKKICLPGMSRSSSIVATAIWLQCPTDDGVVVKRKKAALAQRKEYPGFYIAGV